MNNFKKIAILTALSLLTGVCNTPMQPRKAEAGINIEAVVPAVIDMAGGSKSREKSNPKLRYPIFEELPISKELQAYAQQAAKDYEVPYSLLLAWIEVVPQMGIEIDEPQIWYGVMAVNKEYDHPEMLKDSRHNIQVGCRELGRALKKYGAYNKALVAFICGKDEVKREKKIKEIENGEKSAPWLDGVVDRSEIWEKRFKE